jgi:hypothetical protein
MNISPQNYYSKISTKLYLFLKIMTPRTIKFKLKFIIFRYEIQKLKNQFTHESEIDGMLYIKSKFEDFLASKSRSFKDRLDGAGDIYTYALSVFNVLNDYSRIDYSKKALQNVILIDIRSWQKNEYKNRGIGIFVEEVIAFAKQSKSVETYHFLIDRDLEIPEIFESSGDFTFFGQLPLNYYPKLLIVPSPFTEDLRPLHKIIKNPNVYKICIVFDFIPLKFPTYYLQNLRNLIQYYHSLELLPEFNRIFAISNSTKSSILKIFKNRIEAKNILVTLNSNLLSRYSTLSSMGNFENKNKRKDINILVFSGEEIRKNEIEAIVNLVKSSIKMKKILKIKVLGVPNKESKIRDLLLNLFPNFSELCSSGALELIFLKFITNTDKYNIIRESDAVIIPSLAEGLSLPVLESVHLGTLVACSEIQPHKELLGNVGIYLKTPRDYNKLLTICEDKVKLTSLITSQAIKLSSLSYASLIHSISDTLRIINIPQNYSSDQVKNRIAFLSPRTSFVSGINDMSDSLLPYLTKYPNLDFVFYNSENKKIDLSNRSQIRWNFDNPSNFFEYDFVISQFGNNEEFLPILELAKWVEIDIIAHDRRFTELFNASGISTMVKGFQEVNSYATSPTSLYDLQSKVSNQYVVNMSRRIYVHNAQHKSLLIESGAEDVEQLFFAPHWYPSNYTDLAEQKRIARQRLRVDSFFNVSLFGIVDTTSKMENIVELSCSLASIKIRNLKLNLVGPASEVELTNVHPYGCCVNNICNLVGKVSAKDFNSWFLATDLAIVLRSSKWYENTGVLPALITFGVPTITTESIAKNFSAPSFVYEIYDINPIDISKKIVELEKGYTFNEKKRFEEAQKYLEFFNLEDYLDKIIRNYL